MKAKVVSKDVEAEILNRYYYDDGILRYKRSFNKCKQGEEVGTPCCRGYKRLSILKQKLLVHRVIWFMHYGYWPEYIDHIDQDKSNNRIENLRPCSFPENKRNVRYGEFSGMRQTKSGNWEAYTQVNRQYTYLGRFNSKEEAKAYRDAYIKSLYGDFYAV